MGGAGLLRHSWFAFLKWVTGQEVASVCAEAGVRSDQEDDPHARLSSPTVWLCQNIHPVPGGVCEGVLGEGGAKALQEFPVWCTVIYYLKLDQTFFFF